MSNVIKAMLRRMFECRKMYHRLISVHIVDFKDLLNLVDDLFRKMPTILEVTSDFEKNSHHVLCPYFPENQYQHYHLKQCTHNKTLKLKTAYL